MKVSARLERSTVLIHRFLASGRIFFRQFSALVSQFLRFQSDLLKLRMGLPERQLFSVLSQVSIQQFRSFVANWSLTVRTMLAQLSSPDCHDISNDEICEIVPYSISSLAFCNFDLITKIITNYYYYFVQFFLLHKQLFLNKKNVKIKS